MKPKGLSIIELLVIMAVIFVVTLLVLPIFRPRNCGCDGATSGCMSNLKLIGLSIAQYTQDADETFPYSGVGHDWPDESLVYFPQLVLPYNQYKKVFKCSYDPFTEHGALYEALMQAHRAPSAPTMPVSYYYFYDFYHADIGTSRTPPCTAGVARPPKSAEVLYPQSKAMMICMLSGLYVSGAPHNNGENWNLLLITDGHVKETATRFLADPGCFGERNLDWSGVGAIDFKSL